MKIGNIVKIKSNAIEKGLLKPICKRLLYKEGTIMPSGSAVCKNEVSLRFDDESFSDWIMPKDSLEFVKEKKYMSLTKEQEKEAKALYLHLLNHTEVQEASYYRGMPCCKICNKSAYQIQAEESVGEVMKDG